VDPLVAGLEKDIDQLQDRLDRFNHDHKIEVDGRILEPSLPSCLPSHRFRNLQPLLRRPALQDLPLGFLGQAVALAAGLAWQTVLVARSTSMVKTRCRPR